jgi:hypothetical protein
MIRTLLHAAGAVIVLGLAGCAAEQAETGSVAGTAKLPVVNPRAAPPNYRQIVALKLATVFNAGGVESAEISEPADTWMGLVRGGMQPAVCATVIHRDIGRSNWIFTFNNGKLDEAISSPGAIYCMGRSMSKLSELKKS